MNTARHLRKRRNSLSSTGRGGTLDAPLLGPLLTPASRGEEAKARSDKFAHGAKTFMDSHHDFYAVHWGHEPTPNPSQEGNWHDADECLLPSREGPGVGRFMKRPNKLRSRSR